MGNEQEKEYQEEEQEEEEDGQLSNIPAVLEAFRARLTSCASGRGHKD